MSRRGLQKSLGGRIEWTTALSEYIFTTIPFLYFFVKITLFDLPPTAVLIIRTQNEMKDYTVQGHIGRTQAFKIARQSNCQYSELFRFHSGGVITITIAGAKGESYSTQYRFDRKKKRPIRHYAHKMHFLLPEDGGLQGCNLTRVELLISPLAPLRRQSAQEDEAAFPPGSLFCPSVPFSNPRMEEPLRQTTEDR